MSPETVTVLDHLIERVRTMPSNGVVSRWENVSRSAVIDLLLEARAATPASPEPAYQPEFDTGEPK